MKAAQIYSRNTEGEVMQEYALPAVMGYAMRNLKANAIAPRIVNKAKMKMPIEKSRRSIGGGRV